MALFDQIGKKVSDASRGVAQQTKNFTDTAKLNSAISSEEKSILQTYTEIGRAYYEAHKDDPNAENAEKLHAITEAFERIYQHKEKIKEIKGVLKCPNCGAETSNTSLFCQSCGAKIGLESAVAAMENAGTKICPTCGTSVPADNKFCTSCGTAMNE